VRISSIDLNLLLVLDTVLAERSVTRAARRLHVTPSAISNALSRLRAVFNDPLIARSGRGIVPTPRAAGFAPALTRALQDLEAVIHDEAFDPATTNRELTLAVADAGQVVRVPRLAQLLANQMPHARLRVVGIDAMIAMGGLASTEIDVALGVSDAAPGIHRTPMYEEHTVLVARANHPRVGRRVTKSDLEALRHVDVHVAVGKPSRDVARRYAQRGIERDVAVIVPTFTAAAAVVAATDLVATLPKSLVDVLGPGLGLRAIDSPVRTPPITISLAWHTRTNLDPAMRTFRDLVTAATATAGPVRARSERKRPV
jgi:DNA-binding transcriptional LysR family regulator